MPHTAGPWIVIPDNGNGFYVQASEEAEETIVARCIDYPHMAGLTDESWEARDNANLISAAPEMLAALERVENEWLTDDWTNLFRVIRSAMNKAKGIKSPCL